jgi:hypothetical protein
VPLCFDFVVKTKSVKQAESGTRIQPVFCCEIWTKLLKGNISIAVSKPPSNCETGRSGLPVNPGCIVVA